MKLLIATTVPVTIRAFLLPFADHFRQKGWSVDAMAADVPHGSHAAHGSHSTPKITVPADLMLHAKPPRAGRYALWIQFKGGDQVRTVPFVVDVQAAL